VREFVGRRKLGWAVAVFATAIGAFVLYWQRQQPSAAATSPPPPIPVETTLAARSNVPVYLEGLGTVQAFNTVTVTSRVDGQMQTVNFVEGQEVKSGDVLAQIDPRPFQAVYDQTVATKARDEAQLANARLDLQRDVKLSPQEFTSRQTLNTQQALVAQLEAQVNVDQGAIDAAKANLDYTTIRSPIDGLTGIRLIDAGNNLLTTTNASIVVVTQLHPISVIFTLPEEDLPAVAKAMGSGSVVAIAFARDNKTQLDRGTIAVLDNQINQTTGTLRLKATFSNPHDTLWPGDFVNVRMLAETQQNVVTVPSTAVQRGPDGLYVYLVKPDSTVAVQPIQLEQFGRGQAIVSGGVTAGETVVSSGQYRLQPGTRIESTSSHLANTAPNSSDAPEASP
jgi:multidrug efflux system membrane fusion protein